MNDTRSWSRSTIVGATAIALALGLFGYLALHVKPDTRIDHLDREIAAYLEREGKDAPVAVSFLRFITDLGDKWTLLGLIVVVSIFLAVRRQWLLLTAWVAAQALGGILNYGLKNVFERTRPQFATPLVHESTFSFPSGHSMGSTVAYGMLIYLVVAGTRPGWPRWLSVAFLLSLILCIGFSRMFLGAHWLSDVLGGFAVGTAVVVLCVSRAEAYRRWLSTVPSEVNPPGAPGTPGAND